MKSKYLFILFCSALFLFSCKESSNPFHEYGETVVDKFQSTRQFGDQVSVQRLQEAIRSFHIANGRYPEDMDEIEEFTGEPLDRDKYTYDPSSGKITFNQ